MTSICTTDEEFKVGMEKTIHGEAEAGRGELKCGQCSEFEEASLG